MHEVSIRLNDVRNVVQRTIKILYMELSQIAPVLVD
jgi:hypothetical protein